MMLSLDNVQTSMPRKNPLFSAQKEINLGLVVSIFRASILVEVDSYKSINVYETADFFQPTFLSFLIHRYTVYY
jgi:hypothetical protein